MREWKAHEHYQITVTFERIKRSDVSSRIESHWQKALKRRFSFDDDLLAWGDTVYASAGNVIYAYSIVEPK